MKPIILPFPPSTNNLFVNGKRGRFRSPKYEAWIMEAGVEMMRQRPAKHVGPVNLHYEFQEGRDNRKRDLGNLEKATTDLLVSHRIIEADDGSIVRQISLTWNPTIEGTRVTIEPVFGSAA
ncbi:RusA family crossover junction endodeoxyribonuclease [Bradyrhizobium sp.]|uniref:RusA family crossover junction endodeoxyribonuclease n=1 Tax=Bradyrhizobium sp. TaxID=376 RepID=UPI0025BAD785|nr:RusA family crossover junction endodeoxyribonuclease [Bradyrhizobium sp.]